MFYKKKKLVYFTRDFLLTHVKTERKYVLNYKILTRMVEFNALLVVTRSAQQRMVYYYLPDSHDSCRQTYTTFLSS